MYYFRFQGWSLIKHEFDWIKVEYFFSLSVFHQKKKRNEHVNKIMVFFKTCIMISLSTGSEFFF